MKKIILAFFFIQPYSIYAAMATEEMHTQIADQTNTPATTLKDVKIAKMQEKYNLTFEQITDDCYTDECRLQKIALALGINMEQNALDLAKESKLQLEQDAKSLDKLEGHSVKSSWFTDLFSYLFYTHLPASKTCEDIEELKAFVIKKIDELTKSDQKGQTTDIHAILGTYENLNNKENYEFEIQRIQYDSTTPYKSFKEKAIIDVTKLTEFIKKSW